MTETTFTLETHDGGRLFVYRWLPDGRVKAAVQIAHGASEHAARYRRLAEHLTSAGYAVFANDHRGHGRTADEYGAFGVARPGGWSAMVQDLRDLTTRMRDELADVPIVLFGHSMGSMLAQHYLQGGGADLAGVVLSGTTGGSLIDDDTLAAVVAMGAGEAADQPSEVFAAMFAGFNEPFDGPHATGFEWLSRDAAEVQQYADDPWCGEPLSNGFVADMLSGSVSMWADEADSPLPKGVPIYVFSGSDDPVGGADAESVRDLARRYEERGLGPITLRIYAAGRHEMLNEINRDEVQADLLAWLDSVVG